MYNDLLEENKRKRLCIFTYRICKINEFYISAKTILRLTMYTIYTNNRILETYLFNKFQVSVTSYST